MYKVQIADCKMQNADCQGGEGGEATLTKVGKLWKPMEGVGKWRAECRFRRPVQISGPWSDCRLQIVRPDTLSDCGDVSDFRFQISDFRLS